MINKHFKDMEFDKACWHIRKASPETQAECISLKNDFVEFQSENAYLAISNLLEKSGIESPREIRIFCNIEFCYMNYVDHRKPGWQARFIFDNESLAKLYGTFMIPCGEPSLDNSWIFLASVFDQNLEPLSTLSCNGLRVFKSGR